jgi:hypothetical protein
METSRLSRTIELRCTSKSQEQFLGPRIMHLIGELVGKISIGTPNIYLSKGKGGCKHWQYLIKQIDLVITPTGRLQTFNIRAKMYSEMITHTDECNALSKKQT